MSSYHVILTCLSEKYACFLDLEEVTVPMQYETVEVLEELMEKRRVLFERIAHLDAQIQSLTQEDAFCRQVIEQRVSAEKLEGPLKEISEVSLRCRLSANRLLKNEEVIQLHLESEKQRVMDQMKSLNENGAVLATRYHSSVKSGRNRVVPSTKKRLI